MTLNSNPRKIKVQGAAFRLHRDYEIRSPVDIAIEDIAMAEDLLVTIGALKGADGRLVRKGNQGIARISDSIIEPARQKFTICHEFGHWLLHRDECQFFLCKEDDMYDYRSDCLEIEANSFAAELLMPKRWIKKSFWELEPSIAKLQEMASFFQVSLTAAALRYVELSKRACMVVFSDGNNVRWWRKRENLPFWLQSKQRVDSRSYASECFKTGQKCDGMQDVEPEAWFLHCDTELSELLEDSIYLQNQEILVSLLWFPSYG
ncbi:MAG: ImmA/IrrE family metallo-endopeptidase [Verrucomicrobiota bacterium JB024]|nr:ImmA/IrrE family metallo-endopeptidase [Verrucomicrobiota bacterium JB024]